MAIAPDLGSDDRPIAQYMLLTFTGAPSWLLRFLYGWVCHDADRICKCDSCVNSRCV